MLEGHASRDDFNEPPTVSWSIIEPVYRDPAMARVNSPNPADPTPTRPVGNPPPCSRFCCELVCLPSLAHEGLSNEHAGLSNIFGTKSAFFLFGGTDPDSVTLDDMHLITMTKSQATER